MNTLGSSSNPPSPSGGPSGPSGPAGHGLANDWTDDDLLKLASVAQALGIDDPTIPLRVWAHESDNKSTAHNPNDHGAGLFQLTPMPGNKRIYDYTDDPEMNAFVEKSISEQLDYAQRYYEGHTGKLGSVARMYIANAMPAKLDGFIESGDDPSYNLSHPGGAYYADLDTTGRGFNTSEDFEAVAARATGPRTNELITRLDALLNGGNVA